MLPCTCTAHHQTRRIVLTRGPGAGKTATLELIRQSFCEHVQILPEAAGVVFGGGFPRRTTIDSRKAVQRAVFYVQRELEAAAIVDNAAILLCDRGTLDGAAYWPGPEDFWASVNTSIDEQLGRYHAVIHLRTPVLEGGYNHQNPLRTESASEAAELDIRILHAWERHPRRLVVETFPDFLSKAARVLELLRGELPDCCKRHLVPALDRREPTG
jgi:predicted ATPase